MDFKEFKGKNLIETLEKAGAYFNTKADFLEYQIIKKTTENNGLDENVIIKAKPKDIDLDNSNKEDKLINYDQLTEESKKIVNILDEILNKGDIEHRFTFNETQEELRINIYGPNMKVLLKQQSNGIESLKFILLRIVNNLKISLTKKINIDINDFLKEREKQIRDLAHKLAKKAKITKKEVLVNNYLNPYERRILHLEIQKIGNLRTESLGEGTYKKVKIIPQN